jgi:hypothetical protein
MKTQRLLATLAVSIAFAPRLAHAVMQTVTGTVYTYSTTLSSTTPGSITSGQGAPVEMGRPVQLLCFANPYLPTVRTTWTDDLGRYTVSCDAMAGSTVSVFTAGDEATAQPVTVASSATTVTRDITRAPHMLSIDGGSLWVRKVGDGEYPFVFIEPFDLGNTVHTGDEVAGGMSILSTLAAQPINKAPTAFDGAGTIDRLLPWLLANNYTIYIIASGNAWGNSLMGTGDRSNGEAFQAMKLAFLMRKKYNPDRPMNFLGFSLGGATTKAGLYNWCNGNFYAQIGPEYDLRSGCPEVAAWGAADAPFGSKLLNRSNATQPHLILWDGAHIPTSAQLLLSDPALASSPELSTYRQGLGSGVAKELMVNLKGPIGTCNTGAVDSDGGDSPFFGNSSSCTTDNAAHMAFTEWSGDVTLPYRPVSGTDVPAVAFSLGAAPSAPTAAGAKQTIKWVNDDKLYTARRSSISSNTTVRDWWGCDWTTADRYTQRYWASTPYVDIAVDKNLLGFIPWGTAHIRLYPNGGTEDLFECDHGSRANMLSRLGALANQGSTWALGSYYIPGTYSVAGATTWAPTFITTRSALLIPLGYTNPLANWKDWMTNPETLDGFPLDQNHSMQPFPRTQVGMVLAHFSEQQKGYRMQPVVSATKNLGSNPWGSSRPAEPEIVDGIDNDGDEGIDELASWEGPGVTAAWNNPNRTVLTVVSKNRYWKYNWLTGTWIGSGYFDQSTYTTEASGGTTWSNTPWDNANSASLARVPTVDGLKPWEGAGITAAINPPNSQYLVLFSGNREWVYNFAPNAGFSSWAWAGHVGDNTYYLANVTPWFPYAAAVGGKLPGSGGGITGTRLSGDGKQVTLYNASANAYWTWSYASVAFATSGAQAGAFPTAAYRWNDGQGDTLIYSGNQLRNWTISTNTFWPSATTFYPLSSAWAAQPQPQPNLVVLEATYGANVGAAGNATGDVWNKCMGKGASCGYFVNQAVLGDPSPASYKDFKVTYRCTGTGATKTTHLTGDANRMTAGLVCP